MNSCRGKYIKDASVVGCRNSKGRVTSELHSANFNKSAEDTNASPNSWWRIKSDHVRVCRTQVGCLARRLSWKMVSNRQGKIHSYSAVKDSRRFIF